MLNHLSVANFRNYRELELDLGQGATLVVGENAQGKTNLLEAVYLLATTRSPRTTRDADFVNWQAAREENPVTRLAATAVDGQGTRTVELVIAGRAGSGRGSATEPWPDELEDHPRAGLAVSKRLRVNGIPRRAVDMIGVVSAVFFSTADMDVICGAPAMRRRFLDLMISQFDRAYVGALGRYGKVLSQRNALLKRVQEGTASAAELDFWDEQLGTEGGVIVAARGGAVASLVEAARQAHAPLAAGRERLDARYEPRLGDDGSPAMVSAAEATSHLRDVLARQRGREIAAGMTLAGPHRDDLAILVDGAEAAAFGSRAQQRSAALAMRLGEAALLSERSGRQPVILLDDILSELDAGRRQAVLDAVCECPQVLITSAEPEHFPASFRSASTVLRVAAGQLTAQ